MNGASNPESLPTAAAVRPADGSDAQGQARLHHTLAELRDLAEVRERSVDERSRTDVLSAVALSSILVVAAVLAATLGPAPSGEQWAVLAIGILLYGAASRAEFTSSAGSAVPTTAVQIALVLLVPPTWVPAAVLAGLLLGGQWYRRTGARAYEASVTTLAGWGCLGPVVVFELADVGQPVMADWPLLAAALAAQFVVDGSIAVIRCGALGLSIRRLIGPLAWSFAIDTLLGMLAMAIVVATTSAYGALALTAAPVLLVWLLAQDRQEHLERSVSLGEALVTISEEARVDSMTGVANRRAWDEALVAAETALRDDPTLDVFVVMADLDHLKSTNDLLGHEVGDALITLCARVLSHCAPEGTVAARLGGDEFGLLWRRNGDVTCEELLGAIRTGVRAAPRIGEVTLSVSLGVASARAHGSLAAAVGAADGAAAADKAARRAGRGR